MITLVMSALIMSAVLMLWSTTDLDLQITANQRRISQARLAALSGVSHFTVAAFDLDNIEGEEAQLVPVTQLTAKTAYRVEAQAIEDGKVMVTSWGQYHKADNVIFEYPIRIIVER